MEDTVTLFFELNAPSPGSLLIRPIDAEGQVIERELDPSQPRHNLTIENLAPGTRYELVVALAGVGDNSQQPRFTQGAWGPVSFRTASDANIVRFGVIGDASFGDSATRALIEEMAAYDLDFVLHVGDVVDETRPGIHPFDSYAEKYYLPFEPLLKQMPIYTILGNHDYDLDIRWEGEPFYDYAFPPFLDPRYPDQEARARNQYYAFAYGGIQFVMLDSQVFYGVSGREEQAAWLAERLADSRFVATIPVLHVAPYHSSSVHPADSLPVRITWPPLFESANVPLVFSGHYHHYERLVEGGITYIVSGGGSSTLYAAGELSPQSEVFARRTHFVLVEMDGDRLMLSAIALGGDVIDQVELPIKK
jgi:predicted phosphodiesterase